MQRLYWDYDFNTTFGNMTKRKGLISPETYKGLSITYGPDQQRVKTVYQDNSSTLLTKYFALGMYEKEVHVTNGTRELYFVHTPSGLSAILESKSSGDELHYIHTDILGSYDVITNASGIVEERLSFDPWGRRRSVATWDYNNVPTTFLFDRGFTGHEHLDDFGVINMNGRVYDPLLAIFLSPDNYVQSPENTQNLNRYAYCLNNPLIYTDPDGEFIFTILAAIFCPPLLPVAIGADIGMWQGGTIANSTANPFKWDYSSGKTWGYMAGGAVIGGLAGGSAVGVSALGGDAMMAGAAAGAVGNAGFSGLATGWDGNAMLKGAAFGAISGFVGGGVGSALGGGWGALAGGSSANLTSQLLYSGGDFASVDWSSVVGSGALSLGMYHGMNYTTYKWGGGNNLGGLDIKYRQYCKINTAYQRSRFWHKEYGVYLNRNGSAHFVPANDRHKYSVTFDDWQSGDFATAHTHWAREGINVGGGSVTVGGYHSPGDLANIPGFSLVVGRTTSTYSIGGTGVYNYLTPDPFIRLFMFPWWW